MSASESPPPGDKSAGRMPQPVQPADVHGVAESGRAATDSPPGSADDARAARVRTGGAADQSPLEPRRTPPA